MVDRLNNIYFDPEIIYEFNDKAKLYSHLWSQIKPNPDYEIEDEENEVLQFIPMQNKEKYLDDDGKFENIISSRRSILMDSFKGNITSRQLMELLRINFVSSENRIIHLEKKEITVNLRPYPSGGALYPIQLYCYIKDIDGITEGLYKISSAGLSKIKNKISLRELEELSPITLFKDDPKCKTFKNVNVLFFFVMNYGKNFDKYGLLAHRLGYLEAGHIAQNLLLTAEYLQLDCLPLCGYFDDKVEGLLGIDGKKKCCIYMIAMG